MFAAAGDCCSPAIYDTSAARAPAPRRVGVFGAPEFDAQVWKELELSRRSGTRSSPRRSPCRCTSTPAMTTTIFIEAEATRLYSLLRKNSQPAELRIVDGAHRWPVWESTIGDAMRYVFRYTARPALVTDARSPQIALASRR